MSAGDYRKPKTKNVGASAEWFNWVVYEMAARLGYVQRKGVSTVTDSNLDMAHDNGLNEGPFDLEAVMDEFFDKWDKDHNVE